MHFKIEAILLYLTDCFINYYSIRATRWYKLNTATNVSQFRSDVSLVLPHESSIKTYRNMCAREREGERQRQADRQRQREGERECVCVSVCVCVCVCVRV